ncbi:coiled-coil domain-containing protein 116 isoform X2 [Pseudorca crassidens]|uniref:coiled-coil domain-containing protein 116 isoform X2 n=1 Tax=Pseudorca crassidens TaxID=82174 RepID=UPI00352CC21F
MTSCRHHSGYLADDEAGHTTCVARVQPSKKSLFPEMGQASKLGHTPHPTSTHGPSGSSGLRSHRRNPKGPRPFRSFLDFLVEGQVLDSLQTVVEEATELMATVMTEAGVPLVEVEDPMEVPRGGRQARARPIVSTVHQHCTRPTLCMGRPNNYPSCSSSMSDSHSSFTANWPGSHSWDSDLSARSLGALPPMKDKLLLEKNLKRLLQLENRGKGQGQSCPHGDSLPWDSPGSQTSSQWTLEQPLSWFSGLLGSSSGTPKAWELGPAERELIFLKRELIFLKRELNKKMKSLLSQPGSFDLPGYCALREPHRTLDFLAEHHLFPALQDVVSQAVDKLNGACHRDSCPLFPSEGEPSPESSSKLATPTDGEEPYDLLPTTTSSPRMEHRKSIKYRGRGKSKEGGSPVSSTQVATRFCLEVTPTEEPKVPSPHPRQEGLDQDPKVQRLPMPTSGPLSSRQRAQPWWNLHLTLPATGIVVKVPSRQTHVTTPVSAPLASSLPSSSHHLPRFSPHTSVVRGFLPSPVVPYPEVTSSRLGPGFLGAGLHWKGSYRHRS